MYSKDIIKLLRMYFTFQPPFCFVNKFMLTFKTWDKILKHNIPASSAIVCQLNNVFSCSFTDLGTEDSSYQGCELVHCSSAPGMSVHHKAQVLPVHKERNVAEIYMVQYFMPFINWNKKKKFQILGFNSSVSKYLLSTRMWWCVVWEVVPRILKVKVLWCFEIL